MNQFLNQTKKYFLTLLMIGTLPSLFTLMWLFKNAQLPVNDAANYLLTAINIYQYFDHGFLTGIWHCYVERGWRPITFPIILVPYLLFFKGQLYVAYVMSAMSCLIASVIYIYLFLRLRLARLPALLGTNILGLLPLVQAQFILFYAEAALFPCIIGALYHLIKSNYLRDKKHASAFVILFSLALMLRPVEALTDLVFVFTLFLILGYRREYFTLQQIKQLLLCALLSTVIFFLAAFKPYFHFKLLSVIDDGGVFDKKMAKTLYTFLWLSTALATFVGLPTLVNVANNIREKINLNLESQKTYILPVFMTIMAIVLLWFLPFAFETFQWIYRTSLGDVAVGTGSLSGSQFSWAVLKIYLRDEGLLPIGMISFIAILGWFSMRPDVRKPALFSLPVLFLLLILPFPFWESFYTVQIITRKLSIALPALLMALILIGLGQGALVRLRLLLAALLIIMQFGLLTIFLYHNDAPLPLITHTMGYFIHRPITIQPNPHDQVIAFLATEETRHAFAHIGFEVLPGTPDARHPVEAEPINPFLLSTMLQANHATYSANFAYFGTYQATNMQQLAKHYDALFLSDKVEDMQISAQSATKYTDKYDKETNPSIKTYYELLTYYARDQLKVIGWDCDTCINIHTQEHGEYQGCFLYRIPSSS